MSTPKPLGDIILGKLEQSEFPSGWHHWDQKYMPEGLLEGLITRESIIREFSSDGSSNGEHHDDEGLLLFILGAAKKVLAISLLAGVDSKDLRKTMTIFKANAFDDNRLPIKSSDPNDLPWSKLQWTMVRLTGFVGLQWKFLVPVFRKNTLKLKLENLQILPFKLVNKENREGAFSNVWEVAIHESHLEEPMLKHDGNRANAAIKEIKDLPGRTEKQAHKDWEKESSALENTIGLEHPHIIAVKAIITWTGKGKYFMFQWADGGNLRDFYKTSSRPTLDVGFIKEVIQQLVGLAGALNALHNFKKDDQEAGAIRHGDLKPENILRFEDGTRTGQWKVSDMGLAKHHTLITEKRGATTTRHGTPLYEAPEATSTPGEPRSRQYDIWSMGCVLLELIVWLLYGYEELERFNNCLSVTNISSPYWSNNENPQVHPSVQACMELISQDPECTGSTAIGDLLSIVKTMLLVVPLPPNSQSPYKQATLTAASKASADGAPPPARFRAKADDFHNALKVMLAKGKSNDKYWFTGAPRKNLVGPVNFISSPNLMPASNGGGNPRARPSPGGRGADNMRQNVSRNFADCLPADNPGVAADLVGFPATFIGRPPFLKELHPVYGLI